MSDMSALLRDAVLSVTEFIDLTNQVLQPMRVTIQGEVTSVAVRASAVFFSLADSRAAATQPAKLDCVVWQYRYRELPFKLTEGMQLQVVGRASIYKASGKFSLVAEQLSPMGEGALRQALEALKLRLQQSGLFDAARKRPLPQYPQRVGLVTSLRGDARNDFLTHLGQFGFEVVQVDVRVEGLAATDELVAAIKLLNEQPHPVEVIVITRGGGSLESLQAFNSEAVARAVAASRIPVVSAVGHENDVTIADLVADARASTPTAAAKLLSESWRQAKQELTHYAPSILSAFTRHLQLQQQAVERSHFQLSQLVTHHRRRLDIERQLLANNFLIWQQRLIQFRQTITTMSIQWPRWWQSILQQQRQLLLQLENQLELSDPLRRLQQGYALVSTNQHAVINSVQQLVAGDEIKVQLSDGRITAVVSGKESSHAK